MRFGIASGCSWLGIITDSMDTNLSTFWEIVSPVVTRESHRNSRKTTCFPRHRKMRPFVHYSISRHSSILAWRIPGMGEPGGLPSNGVAQSRTQLKRLSSSSSSTSIYILITGTWHIFTNYNNVLKRKKKKSKMKYSGKSYSGSKQDYYALICFY